jgi:1,4-dihydroxy-2-naphthoate octaprenyltransferase
LLKDYLAELFDPILLLAFFTSLVGAAAAFRYGSINYLFAAMAVVGSVLVQMSVNLINDYEDYSTGMDKENMKTNFSGGSRFVASGAVKHAHVLYLGIAAAALAALIGTYLALVVSILLLALIAFGAASIFLYTRYILKLSLLAEPFVMLSFALVGAGSYIVAHGSLSGLGSTLFAIVPAGILVGLALLVNEVPDAEIDKKYGRRHSVIVLNSNRRVSAYYIGMVSIAYLLVMYGVISALLSPLFLLVILTMPAAAYVAAGISNYKNPREYEKFMASNALSTFIYLILLILAYAL